MDVSENGGYPQIMNFNKVFHYKPSILGSPYFWKHPQNHLGIPTALLKSCTLSSAFKA